MKFFALLALVATTQSIQLKSKAATQIKAHESPENVTLSIPAEKVIEVANKIDTLTGQLGEFFGSDVIENAFEPMGRTAELGYHAVDIDDSPEAEHVKEVSEEAAETAEDIVGTLASSVTIDGPDMDEVAARMAADEAAIEGDVESLG